MDADGTSFSFPSASDFNKDQESSDISWGDIFLDGIHSEESPLEKLAAGELDVPSENSGPSVISQQVIQQQHTQQQQQQQGIMGGQVHIQIPTHLQGTISTNGLQQTSTSISGSVAYLAPSVTTSQLVSSENNFQNVMTAAGQRLVTTSITQQQQTQQQANAKLVQLAAPSFPVASVQQLPNSVPLQTLLQSNPTLTNQTLYRNQSGLFPTQGSVHIENPKVVNVNFGPHVIGSDGSSQQALIQTAEGKPVFITNSQLQQMSQSLNLTQPLVGTQLLNQGGGNVLRTTLAQGQQSVVNQPRQIVLPSGQAVIPRQPDPTAAAKSVVLRQLNPSVSPVIYPGGQGGQLQLQPQSTALITSTGQGLQVVNTAGGQGNQVQLIAQSQLGQGQQQLNQNALVNLLNGQGMLNNGLVQSGQNILVNGQVVNLGQLGGMALQQQLQLQQQQQQQQQSTNTVSLGQAVVNRPVARQLQQQQLQNQPNTQQPVFLSQNTPGVSVVGNNAQQQLNAQIMLQQQQQKVAVGLGNPLTNIQQQGTFRPGGTLTPNNTGSNCSTPAPTPTPSTPTPTPTPDLMLDPNSGNGGKGGQSSNILEQALTMSDIDLQSFEDDFNLLDECLPSVPAPPAPAPAITPAPAPTPTPAPAKSKPKRQSKKSKAAAQQQQPKGQTTTVQNTQGQKVTLTPQQKIIATNGQVYVLSANGQQLILQQPSTTTVTSIAPQLKPIPSQAAPSSVSTTPSRNISTSVSQQRTPQLLLAQNHSVSSGNVRQHQSKIPIIPSKMGFQAQKNVYVSASVQSDNKGYVKTSTDLISNDSGSKISSGKSSVQAEQKSSVPFSSLSTSISGNLPYTCSVQPSNQTLSNQQQVKAQKITTLDGSFVKQEPLTAVVKQEPVASQQQVLPFSSSQSLVPSAPLSGFPAVSQAITSGTSSNIAPISSSLVVSTAMTSTVTTQSHQSTIMITSPSVGTAAGSYATTTSSSNTTTTSKSSNSKEKDPNTIKSMTPIRIANSTLTLSLTPAQKERLEDHLSRMTMREQNEFLAHQQNLNKRIQQVQQEQQQKLLQQQQKQQQQQQQQQSQVSLQQQANHQPAVSATTTAPSPSAVLRLPNQKTNVTQQSQPASSQLLRFKRQQKPVEQNGTTISAASETNGSSAPALLLPKTVEELENEMTECKKNSQPAAPASTQHEQLSQKKGLGQQQQQQLQQQQPTPVPQRQPQQLLTQALQTPQATPAQPGSSQTPVQQQQQQAVYPQMGICLAEQQLIRDRSLALNPDTNTNFKNLSDAMRRLVRYHTLQDHKPEEDSKTIKTWDAKYSKLSDYLMKKKRYYMRRYNKLRLYNDMCQERRPESLQNLMCFNEQLKELFEAEKEEAKNHPETFQPIRPVERAPSPEEPEPPLFPERQYRIPIASLSREERRASKKAKRKELSNFGSHFKEPQIKEEVTEARTKHEIWESPKPLYSSLKRKCSPETGSSGTLKLVFKRRTTDDFSVKNSVDVAKGLKPVVNLEKSDSEYEFEAGCSSRLSQSVKVRRRTSSQSLASHQSVVDVCSDRSSVHSSNDEASENSLSEEEEDNDNEGDRSASAFNSDEDENEEDDDGEVEEDLVESVNLEHDTSTSGNKSGLGNKGSKRNCHVSFEGDDEDQRAMYNHVEEGAFHEVRNGQRESDAFMETDDSVIAVDPVEKTNCVKETRNLFSSVFKFSDISSGSLSSVKKLGRSFSKSASVTSVASDDVFTSASTPDCVPGAEAVSACPPPLNLGALQAISTGPSVTADTASVSQASLLHHHSTFQPMDSLQSPPLRSTRKSDVSSALTVLSSVSNMEKEAASQGLPASSILNTPSKSLLQTDAMFNSSDDDDDDDDNILGSSQSRLVNRFKIDNRDPQSSMINDSVRSAINRALIDNDDSNGPEGEDSQASWSSAQRAPSSASSSVAHNGIFRLSSSPTLHPTHDTDLDAAVQSIING